VEEEERRVRGESALGGREGCGKGEGEGGERREGAREVRGGRGGGGRAGREPRGISGEGRGAGKV